MRYYFIPHYSIRLHYTDYLWVMSANKHHIIEWSTVGLARVIYYRFENWAKRRHTFVKIDHHCKGVKTMHYWTMSFFSDYKNFFYIGAEWLLSQLQQQYLLDKQCAEISTHRLAIKDKNLIHSLKTYNRTSIKIRHFWLANNRRYQKNCCHIITGRTRVPISYAKIAIPRELVKTITNYLKFKSTVECWCAEEHSQLYNMNQYHNYWRPHN